MNDNKIRKAFALLIIVSALIRAFLAWSLEFGNDEVYYWTYALFPDWSHFDHPPMVGWVIQIFSLNLLFDSELCLRLSSIIFGSINCILIYLIGKRIKDSRTGFYAAFLYTTSVYGFIITGIFILPDTPQMLFWLLSILFAINSFSEHELNSKARNNMMLTGFFTGLGMLSKYTTIFIWTGLMFYIIFYDRKWLKCKWLYISMIISLVIFSPVIYWNISNEFISFTYQSERVNFFTSGLRLDYFIMEMLGEILYNNPVNFVLVILAVIAVYRKKLHFQSSQARIILLIGLPMIAVFIIFSLFRRTLPHWSAPAYTTLLILAATKLRDKNLYGKLLPVPIRISAAVLLFIVIAGFLQIKTGLVRFTHPLLSYPTILGKYDFSLEIYGWDQIGSSLGQVIENDKAMKIFHDDYAIITTRWFPAANLDYYVGRPNHLKTFAIGAMSDIHKYFWINKYQGGFYYGMDAYFISTSYDYSDPKRIFPDYFEKIKLVKIVKIARAGKPAMNAFIFRMENMKLIPALKFAGH